MVAYDRSHDTKHAQNLMNGVRAEDNSLADEVDRILATHGGRLFAGFELTAPPDAR